MKMLKKIRRSLITAIRTVNKITPSKISRFFIFFDMLYCCACFHCNCHEYSVYQLYNHKNRYRRNFLFRYHQRVKYTRVNNVLTTVDKYGFYLRLSDLFQREIILAPSCGQQAFADFLKKHKTVILKPNDGSCGRGVQILNYESDEQAAQYFRNINSDTVCEEFICQHESLNALNPYSVNTLRVVSVRHDSQNIEIVSCTLKSNIKNGSVVDNLSDSGCVAAVDIKTGIVSSFGYDLNHKRYTHHPITKTQFIGLNIPNWQKVIDLVEKAHSRLEENPIVGFDIAITPNGADIVEGNSAPGPNIMQIMDLTPKGEKIHPILNDKKKQIYKLPELQKLRSNTQSN